MGTIRELEPDLINKIAAGEVIESSHSVVKELLENSLDAKSQKIAVKTSDAGLGSIIIEDDGIGITEEDLPLSIKKHATSKITVFEDLEKVLSFGFRGEALASIASVSRMTVYSGTGKGKFSQKMEIDGGIILGMKSAPLRKGTFIEVRDLFYNAPVRRKFVKAEKSEDRKIRERFITTALSSPDTAFELNQNSKLIYKLNGESCLERIASLFGENIVPYLREVNMEKGGMRVNGFISLPSYYRSNRSQQYIFINQRLVEIKYASFFIKNCYGELIPSQAHPVVFLFFTIDPRQIDVNVHPAKKEIRFLDEERFQQFLRKLISSGLGEGRPLGILDTQVGIEFSRENKPTESLLLPYVQSSRKEGITEETSIASKEAMPNSEVSLDESRIRFYGQVFGTYLLIGLEGDFFIIDQHTAHERIRYEEILDELKEKKLQMQNLLTPILVDLSKEEAMDFHEKKQLLDQLGFQSEEFGGNSILIRTVPAGLMEGKEKEFIIGFLSSVDSSAGAQAVYDQFAKNAACRSAIKKNDHLSDSLFISIIQRLFQCKEYTRCPHGRPTLIRMTQADLDKMFNRIQ